jgi:hypothetical protein
LGDFFSVKNSPNEKNRPIGEILVTLFNWPPCAKIASAGKNLLTKKNCANKESLAGKKIQMHRAFQLEFRATKKQTAPGLPGGLFSNQESPFG